MDLVDWLEARRLREGLTAADFAKAIDLDPSVYSRLVRRRRRLSADNFAKIVLHFDEDCREVIALWKASSAA